MANYFFFPTGAANARADVERYADAYFNAFAAGCPLDRTAVLDALPRTLDLNTVLERVPEAEREATRRYLSQQITAFGPRAQEMMPRLPGEAPVDVTYVALAEPWRRHHAGTIAAVRRATPAGLLAVFDGWRLDATGRLAYTEPPVQHAAPVAPAVDAAVMRPDADPDPIAQHSADVILTLVNYVGQFLAMTGLPGVGLLVSFLTSETQKLVDGAFAQGHSLLTAFQKLLQQNRIKLENDLAGAVITNYKDFMHTHYSDDWLQQVMSVPDPIPQEVQDRLEKLRKFIKKITDDFDTTSDLFTAVDLLRESTPAANSDVHDASESMYKAGGFFYLANVALTLGRQAFNAQYTMEGSAAAWKIADRLSASSTIYVEYVAALKAAVDRQVEQRLALIHPSESGGTVWIWDNYYPTPEAGALVYSRHCCGGDDCAQKARDRDAILNQKVTECRAQYRKELCAKFWDGTDQSFDQAVAAMQDNDKKLKVLVQSCRNV